jgi:twinkle protein
MLKAARTLSHQRIEQFSTLRQALKQKLSSGQLIEGSSTPSIPGLTQICKGFRRGEMVVVSGPTGEFSFCFY